MFHESNAGKGASLRTWFRQATREYAIVQDADLEYDPKDYARLLEAAQRQDADVVYGTRFAGRRPQMAYTNWVGNRVLTWLTNRLYGSALSDMETCYKSSDGTCWLIWRSNRTNVATRRASSVESARRTASIGFLDSTRWTTRAVWFSAARRQLHTAALRSIFTPPFSPTPGRRGDDAAGDDDEFTLKETADRIRDEISAIPRISQVEITSARPYEIAIEDGSAVDLGALF